MSGLLDALRGKPKVYRDDDIDEWARHHDDPRAAAGHTLMNMAFERYMTQDQLQSSWESANRLVGKRAPADYGEFLAYGYFRGRLEQARIDRNNRLFADDES